MKTLVPIFILSLYSGAAFAQDIDHLNKVWTFYEFEKIDKIGTIGGLDQFKILDFTKPGVLFIKGVPEKADTAIYVLRKNLIVIKSVNKVPDYPNGSRRMEIKITRLSKDFLDLLFTFKESGTRKGAFKLKYKSGN